MKTKMTAEKLNSLTTDIAELVYQRTRIDDEQQEELWNKIHMVLDDFFEHPAYIHYN